MDKSEKSERERVADYIRTHIPAMIEAQPNGPAAKLVRTVAEAMATFIEENGK